jgi:hypothetical protein
LFLNFMKQSVQLRRTRYSNNVCNESTTMPVDNELVNCATALVLVPNGFGNFFPSPNDSRSPVDY